MVRMAPAVLATVVAYTGRECVYLVALVMGGPLAAVEGAMRLAAKISTAIIPRTRPQTVMAAGGITPVEYEVWSRHALLSSMRQHGAELERASANPAVSLVPVFRVFCGRGLVLDACRI